MGSRRAPRVSPSAAMSARPLSGSTLALSYRSEQRELRSAEARLLDGRTQARQYPTCTATALPREGTYAAILRSSRHAARYVKTRTFFKRESSDAMRPGSLPLMPCASKDHAIASRLSSTSAALVVSTPEVKSPPV